MIWVDWFNHHRIMAYNDDLPPVEAEQFHYAQPSTSRTAALPS